MPPEPAAPGRLTRRCPAKLNLLLHVGPLRDDGYHAVESVTLRIDLCDELTVEPAEDGALTLVCDAPGVPSDGTNLALRAAELLRRATGVSHGARLRLEKRIPPGAGLGGGSSDAAGALLLLNELWRCGLSKPELMSLAAQLGSDVPLFLGAPLCALGGRGEVVTELEPQPAGWAVLVLSGLHAGTREVYAGFDRLPSPAATTASEWLASALGASPARRACPVEPLLPHLRNDLEPAAMRVVLGLAELATAVRSASPQRFAMTGSGSALYTLCDSAAGAGALVERLAAALPPSARAVAVTVS